MIIWSGGQTGVDRAAWDAAIACGLAHDGWVPRGRLSEDGAVPARYTCRETKTAEYPDRTERNLRDADATLILSFGKPQGGTLITLRLCRELSRPHLQIDLEKDGANGGVQKAIKFIRKTRPEKLNVAGPRGSFRPDVYERSFRFLTTLFEGLR